MSLLPIWLRPRAEAALSGSSARVVAGGAGVWMRGLIVMQIGISIVLAIGAGVLGRSLQLLSNVDLGVRQEGVLVARLYPVPGGYRDLDNAAYYPPMLERIAGLAGVRSVAQGRAFSRITGDFGGEPIAFVGDEVGDARATWEVVSPAYFETLGIPVLSGRVTSWADNERSRHVAVVSERLARSLSPDGNVVGKRVRMGTVPQNQDVEIVGVVGNATLGNPRQPDVPVLYRPVLQSARLANYPVLLIRSDATSATIAAAVRQIIADGNREFLVEVEPLKNVLARAPSSERMSATLAITVAVLALILSFTGVFALLAYSVTRRTREIGVRSALGAEQASVMWMVMREGLVLTASGVLMGLPIAYFGARVLATLTYGISSADPLTFAMSALVFVAIGVAAGIVPARRAARVDPVIALRAE
jgi:predicted permease